VRPDLVDLAAARMPHPVGLHYYWEPISPLRLQHNEGAHYPALNIIITIPYIEAELGDEGFANATSTILKDHDCVMMPHSAFGNRWRAARNAEGRDGRRGKRGKRFTNHRFFIFFGWRTFSTRAEFVRLGE